MSQLPIDAVLSDIAIALQSQGQCLVEAPPGAGKSTRLPLYLLKTGQFNGKIVLLEPRRLAARSIAQYLADQLGEPLGETIGLCMRGERLSGKNTRLEVVTEGVMTRWLQNDPELDGVDLIIFDEFHERSLHADTALAFALETQAALREDLRLLVMSATLSSTALSAFLPKAMVIVSEGRSFPIEVRYATMPRQETLVPYLTKQIQSLLVSESGSILVFLPTLKSIRDTLNLLQLLVDDSVIVVPLHGQLSLAEQRSAILPSAKGTRKVVLATNIAETSLTIEGIRIVVDSGLERVSLWDAKTGLMRLDSRLVCQSSAIQRAGRAGRLEAGICVRLYSETTFQRQPKAITPEILRSDLTGVRMELAQWGSQTFESDYWLDKPSDSQIEQTSQRLREWGAFDQQDKLTLMGKGMMQWGTDPRFAAILTKAKLSGRVDWCWAAAVLVSLLEQPIKSASQDLNVWLQQKLQGHHAQRANRYFLQLCPKTSKPNRVMEESILPVLLAGFSDWVAQCRSNTQGRYQLASGQGVRLLPNASLQSHDMLLILSLTKLDDGDSTVFLALPIQWGELESIAPDGFTTEDRVDWDDKKGRITAERCQCWGSLIQKRQTITQPDSKLCLQGVFAAIQRQGVAALNFSSESQQWLIRVRCAALWQLSEDSLDLSDAALLANLSDWLAPFCDGVRSLKALKKINLQKALEAYVGWSYSAWLKKALPTHYRVPTGNLLAIRYEEGKLPILSVRLQEMFGQVTSPSLLEGRISMVLELLSPAHRPLQVTQDLAAFWQGAYTEVKKEMKGRYPKHVWPDDPANHKPTHLTKQALANEDKH